MAKLCAQSTALSVKLIGLAVLLLIAAVARPGRSQDIEQIEQQYVRAMERGDFADAVRLAQQARDLVLRIAPEETEALALVYQYLGDAHNGRGQYTAAMDAYRQGYDLVRRERGDSPELAAFMTAFGNVLVQTGRIEEGEAWIRRSLRSYLRSSGENSAGVADCLYRLGALYAGTGRYAEAEPLLRRALEITQRAEDVDPADLSYVYDALADVCINQHRLDEAETLVRRSIALRQRELPADHIDHMDNLWDLGMIYLRRGNYAEAEKYLAKTLENYEAKLGPDHYLTANVRFYTADAYSHLGRWDEALAMYQKVLESAFRITGGAEHPEAIWVYNALAKVHLHEEDLDAALENANKAVQIGALSNVATQRFISHDLRSQVLWRQGNRSAAVADLEQAMSFAEQQRGLASGADHQRAKFFASFADAFERMVAWQLELENLNSALAAMERSRARSLLDQMKDVDLLAGVPVTEAERLRDQERAARQAVTRLESQLNQIRGDDSLSEEEKVRRTQQCLGELQDARHELVAAYAEIRNASPVYQLAVGQDERPVDLFDLQDFVESREGLLLQYLLGGSGGYVLVVPAGSDPELVPLEVTAQQATVLGVEPGPLTATRLQKALLNEAGTGVLDQIRRVGVNPRQAADVTPQLKVLWEVLVPANHQAQIAAGDLKRLMIVPDGPLTMLPFESLVVAVEDDRPRYVLDVGPPVVYEPSSTIMWNLSQRPAASLKDAASAVLSVGDPAYGGSRSAGDVEGGSAPSRYRALGGELSRLPFSAWETTWLEQVFGKYGITVEKLTRADATEANVRRKLDGRRVVHLACHGLTDTTYGNMFGALALTPGSGRTPDPNNDGFLTLAEIYGLPLRQCELAILSACDTNVGPQQRGEGVWALSRGFLVAGSKRVVASNWYVDDRSAAGLISYFCSGIAKAEGAGQPVDYAESLHLAKRWVREQEKWSSPYYWATFVLVGPQ